MMGAVLDEDGHIPCCDKWGRAPLDIASASGRAKLADMLPAPA
jgi:hypothetical protein